MADTPSTEPIHWHALNIQEVTDKLSTCLTNGLTDTEAKSRFERDGPNSLPAAKRMSAFVRFLLQFHNVLIYLLIAIMIFCLVLQEWIEGIVIFAVIILNALIGFIQENKSAKDCEALAQMLSLHANVARSGFSKEIDSTELVVGDIVFLQGGDKIPADCRLIEAKNFQTQEAALTGETTSNPKTIESLPDETVLGERTNMVFSGTHASQGTAKGIVTATGIHTEIGKINAMVQNVDEQTTPLTIQIDKFGHAMVIITVVLIVITFCVQFFMNMNKTTWQASIIYAASLGVAAVPEGMPAIIALTLAIGMQRMARKKALIRSMPAVETLGAVSVICSDKTGTLTTNQMTTRAVLTASRRYRVSGTGYDPCDGEIANLEEDEELTLEERSSKPHQKRKRGASSSTPSAGNTSASPHKTDSSTLSKVTSFTDKQKKNSEKLKNGRPPRPLLKKAVPKSQSHLTTKMAASHVIQKKVPSGTPRPVSSMGGHRIQHPMTPLPGSPPPKGIASMGAQSSGPSAPVIRISTPRVVTPQMIAPAVTSSLAMQSGTGAQPKAPQFDHAVRQAALEDAEAAKSAANTAAALSGFTAPSASHGTSAMLGVKGPGGIGIFQPDSLFFYDQPRIVRGLVRCGLLCNDSALLKDENDNWAIQGDTTEGALYPLAIKCGVDVAEMVLTCPRVDVIPFESDFGYMAAAHRCPIDPSDISTPTSAGNYFELPYQPSGEPAPDAPSTILCSDIIFLKGAPEKVFTLCTEQAVMDSTGHVITEPIDVDFWKDETEKIAAVGLRTIALAQRTCDIHRFENPAAAQEEASGPSSSASGSSASSASSTGNASTELSPPLSFDDINKGNFTIWGVVGIFDPPRSESKLAIANCKKASIKVIMITGDHAKTAGAIGKLLGLNATTVLTSPELAKMNDAELLDRVDKTEIYARATPADKLRLVKALQAKGHITAMTGDGVNDAPALKQAHAGVAMGINGTEVAKEASKMILLDDNFATIVSAVEQGRMVYNSLKRSITYIQPTGAAEVLTLFISSFISYVPPITALQILWVNTITSVTLSSLIPFQKGERNVLNVPPRDTKKGLLTSTVIFRTIMAGLVTATTIIIYFYTSLGDRLDDDLEVRRHSATAVNMIVFAEIFFLFNTVYLKDSSFTWRVIPDVGNVSLIAIVVLICAQVMLTYIPGLNTTFGMYNMKWYDWGMPILCGIILFIVVEIEKAIRRWRHRYVERKNVMGSGTTVATQPEESKEDEGSEESEAEDAPESESDDEDKKQQFGDGEITSPSRV